jgi:molecular chaperone GrpE
MQSAKGGAISDDDVTIEASDDTAHQPGKNAFGRTEQEELARAKDELVACRTERDQFLDGWQRSKADFANLKKRSEEEAQSLRRLAEESLVADLIPVLESFSMAMANKEAWGRVDEGWRRGVEFIRGQFEKVLSERGLSEVDPVGQPFDPRDHTAIATVRTDDTAKEHIVAEVVQKGYRVGDRIIRPAQVKVYEFSPPDEHKGVLNV